MEVKRQDYGYAVYGKMLLLSGLLRQKRSAGETAQEFCERLKRKIPEADGPIENILLHYQQSRYGHKAILDNDEQKTLSMAWYNFYRMAIRRLVNLR